MVSNNQYVRRGNNRIGVQMSAHQDCTFSVLVVLLVPLAVLAIKAPAVLLCWFGGPRAKKAHILETSLRVAGAVFLVGATITLYRLWKT